MSFNVGPANFGAHLAVRFNAPGTTPDAFTGDGQVTATDLDALLDLAKQNPAMQTAFAVLTLAKGIGRSSGNQTVWDITYQGGKVLVNGVDVLAMMGPARIAPDSPHQ